MVLQCATTLCALSDSLHRHILDFLPFTGQWKLSLALGARWSIQQAMYDKQVALNVQVLTGNVATANVCIIIDECPVHAFEECLGKLPVQLYRLSLNAYYWTMIRCLATSPLRMVDALDVNLGCMGTWPWMQQLPAATHASNLSCKLMHLKCDCRTMGPHHLEDLFQNLCVPHCCWHIYLRNVASIDVVECVLDVVYQRWMAERSRPSKLTFHFVMKKQTELQWAGIQTNITGILVDKAGWQRMCTKVSCGVHCRRRTPAYSAIPTRFEPFR